MRNASYESSRKSDPGGPTATGVAWNTSPNALPTRDTNVKSGRVGNVYGCPNAKSSSIVRHSVVAIVCCPEPWFDVYVHGATRFSALGVICGTTADAAPANVFALYGAMPSPADVALV